MSAFVDASVIVAILAEEVDGEELAYKLDSLDRKLISAIVEYETITAIARTNGIGIEIARNTFHEFS